MKAYSLRASDIHLFNQILEKSECFNLTLGEESFPEIYWIEFDSFCLEYPIVAEDPNYIDPQAPYYFGTYYVEHVNSKDLPTQKGKIFLFADRISVATGPGDFEPTFPGYLDNNEFREVILLQCLAEFILHFVLKYGPSWRGYSFFSPAFRTGLARFVARDLIYLDAHLNFINRLSEDAQSEHNQFYMALCECYPVDDYSSFYDKLVQTRQGFWLNEITMRNFLSIPNLNLVDFLKTLAPLTPVNAFISSEFYLIFSRKYTRIENAEAFYKLYKGIILGTRFGFDSFLGSNE